MTAEEQKAEEKRIAVKEQNRMTIAGSIFSRLSRIPFVNIWLRKKVETSREVVREEAELFRDLRDHEESFNTLLNIDNILREDDAQFEANALAAERRLAEEQRKATARETDDRIFQKQKEYEETEINMKTDYEIRKLAAKYKIELDPLEKAAEKLDKPPEPAKKKTTRGPSAKQKEREDAHKRFERAIARIEKLKMGAKAKAELKEGAKNDLEEDLQDIGKEP
jgi:hypothetical protein